MYAELWSNVLGTDTATLSISRKPLGWTPGLTESTDGPSEHEIEITGIESGLNYIDLGMGFFETGIYTIDLHYAGSHDSVTVDVYTPLNEALSYLSTCPVDLSVEDPDGMTIDKQSSEISGALYVEMDVNGDGDLDDLVTMLYPKEGDYQITVIPESGAMPADTYSLTASRGDSTIVLAENSPVADIPDEPYILTVKRPDGDSNTTVVIIATVSAFAVIVTLAILLRRKSRQTDAT